MMKKIILTLLIGATLNATAQSRDGITNIADTSFTVTGDYQKNLKKYPFIQIVPDSITKTVKEKRGLVYCTMGDRQLHIDAFTPAKKTKKKIPAIIIVHGGGWRSGNRTQHIPLAQRLAALGYASFTVEYRLSTEALYPAPINDIRSAIQWLRANAKQFNIDTSKIVVAGFSAGGHLAALTGMTSGLDKFDANDCNKTYSSKVQAVIDIDGTLSFVHPESSETQKPTGMGASALWLGYPRTEHIDLWTEASPLTYAARNTLPFLFLNSAVERMHAGRNDFKKMMDEKGVYTEVVNFPDTPHAFCFYRPWFDPMLNSIDQFLKKIFP